MNYEEIYHWRQQEIALSVHDGERLQDVHDEVFRKTIDCAKDIVRKEQGLPPAPFAFFLMGSAGRREQSVLSDQDHGLMFEGEHRDYFLRLGNEISHGLEIAGYALCEGRIMASNSLWCQQVEQFKLQQSNWLEEASLSSLRYISILFDSRVLVGSKTGLLEVKNDLFQSLHERPGLYERLIENVSLTKKSIGLFGQLLPESTGETSGMMDLKSAAFFPYVNALRLMALKKRIIVPSTLERFESVRTDFPEVYEYKEDFQSLLEFRLRLSEKATSYKHVHFVATGQMNKKEKQRLKHLIRQGHKLFELVKSIVREEA